MAEIQIKNLGLVSYDNAMEIMEDLHADRIRGAGVDTLLVLEHFPVITKGRRLIDVKIPNEEAIVARGIQIRQADRGGLLTYHGPGQIVLYFILKLEDYFDGVAGMVAMIEKTLQGFLATQGVLANVVKDHPGLWVNGFKIASLGLRVSQGVTKHGLSLNLMNDLVVYNLFDPCGMSGQSMTNFEKVTERSLGLKDFHTLEWQLVHSFQHELQDSLIRQKLIA